MGRRALFLDRDGVVNHDYGYVSQSRDFVFIDGIFDLCREAVSFGYLIIIVTNQAGIGRGYYTERDFQVLTSWMLQEFEREGVTITEVFHCPSHPTRGVGEYRKDDFDRKPNPGMILKAAEKYEVLLEESILVGDKVTDVEAGLRANIGQNVLLGPRGSDSHLNYDRVVRIESILQAREFL